MSLHRDSVPCALLFGALLACDTQVDPSYEGEPLATLRGVVETDANAAADVGVLWFTSAPALECSGPVTTCERAAGGPIDESDPDPEACFEACDQEFQVCAPETADAFVACYQDCGGNAEVHFGLELCINAAVGDRVSVDGDFPATFALNLLSPPPDEALLLDGHGTAVAIGFIVALDPAAQNVRIDFDSDDEDELAEIVGGARDVALIYAAQDIPAGSEWAEYLGGTYASGYHLVEAVAPGAPCGSFDNPCTDDRARGLRPASRGLDTELTIEFGGFYEIAWPLL